MPGNTPAGMDDALTAAFASGSGQAAPNAPPSSPTVSDSVDPLVNLVWMLGVAASAPTPQAFVAALSTTPAPGTFDAAMQAAQHVLASDPKHIAAILSGATPQAQQYFQAQVVALAAEAKSSTPRTGLQAVVLQWLQRANVLPDASVASTLTDATGGMTVLSHVLGGAFSSNNSVVSDNTTESNSATGSGSNCVGGVSSGAIGGIVVLALLFVIFLILFVYMFFQNKKNKAEVARLTKSTASRPTAAGGRMRHGNGPPPAFPPLMAAP